MMARKFIVLLQDIISLIVEFGLVPLIFIIRRAHMNCMALPPLAIASWAKH